METVQPGEQAIAARGTIAALRERYGYNPRTLRYRDNVTGQFVSARDVKRSVNAVIASARQSMRDLSDRMFRREITLGRWQELFGRELKNLHVASAMAGAGGMAQMTAQDYGRVGARLRFEYGRLEQFAKDLAARQFKYGQLRTRVEMYCEAGNVSYEASRRDGAVRAGYHEERNQLGTNENHCVTKHGTEGCIDLAALGWVPLGTLPPPGYRVCMSRCRCSLQFRKIRRKAESR